MKKIQVKSTVGHPPQEVVAEAFVPYDGCPIAASRPVLKYIGAEAFYQPDKGEFLLLHVPSGKSVGGVRFPTRKAALDYIPKLKPNDPAWKTAIGSKDDKASVRCFELYKAAGPAR